MTVLNYSYLISQNLIKMEMHLIIPVKFTKILIQLISAL